MNSTTMIIIGAVAGIAIGFTACLILRKTTIRPEGEVARVAYADKILLHQHPQKVLNYLPNLQDSQIAYLYGMTTPEYQAATSFYGQQAKDAAVKLLQNSGFARKVENLPFKKDQTILVLGESTADALNSWVYILKHLLEQRRPQDNIKIVNAAISGQTTTEALRRITAQVKANPDWILCHLGANDCMRYGNPSNKPAVSISETLENLRAIREIVAAETKANLIWMTPAPVHEEKIASFPPFKSLKLFLKNEDLLAVADSMLNKQEELVIDMRQDFGVPARAELVQFDGGHLTVDGQVVVVKAIVETLSHSSDSTAR